MQVFNIVQRQSFETISKNCKPKPYQKIIKNIAVAPVKQQRIDHGKAHFCECLEDEDDPCGESSNCINRCLQTECNNDNCKVGLKCKNRSFQRAEYKKLDLIFTGNRGWGLICKEDLSNGNFVIEYVGELINNQEMERRMKKKIHNKETNFYFLQITSDLTIDAEPKGNLARFINHSCHPNLDPLKYDVNGYIRVGLFANQDISADTELTFNYNLMCEGERTRCQCSHVDCTGFIGGTKKSIKEIAKKDR